MRISKSLRSLIIMMLTAVLVVSSTGFAMAATAKSVKYNGGGKVTITYADKVSYDDLKVSVKDTDGNSYGTSVKSKSSTSIQIQIKSYKSGKKYKVSISGLNVGKVSATFKIYSKKEATSTAKSTAKEKWKAKSFTNVSAKSTTYKSTAVWKVTFKSGSFNYTYMVSQQKGKVIYYERKKAD